MEKKCNRTRGAVTHVAAALLATFLSVPACAMGGASSVEIPERLIEHIRDQYPGFYVPDSTDMVDAWADYAGGESVPYACRGDFDGNGKEDVALLLVGEERWRLLSFHQTGDHTYEAKRLERFRGPDKAYTENNPPQRFLVRTLKAGEKLEFDSTTADHSLHDFDSIIFVNLSVRGEAMQYRWNGDRNSYSVTSYNDLREHEYDD